MRWAIVLGVMALAGACSPPRESAVVEPSKTETVKRFFGRETYTIRYAQTGVEAGEIVEHVREWGSRRAELTKTTMQIAGVSVAKDQRLITDGEFVVLVDNVAGAVTRMPNPLYSAVIEAMDGRDAKEFGEAIMQRLGGVKTGEEGMYAGHVCEFWAIQQLKTRACVAPWGATLYTATAMPPITFERTAVEVRMNDGGPDEAFAYDASKIEDLPAVQLDPAQALSALEQLGAATEP